jgi:DNA-binding NtrC family response regulator
MMALEGAQRKAPFSLVVTGEAECWQPALRSIIGPRWLTTHAVQGGLELLRVVEAHQADAAVLDDVHDWGLDALQLLRMVRRLDARLPVVVLTSRRDRRWLEHAMRLAAFSVVIKPLELEPLLRELRRVMVRADVLLRLDGRLGGAHPT